MDEFWQSFTNREISTFTWIGIFFILFLTFSKKSSASFLEVIKAFFSLKLIPFYQLIILYNIWILYFLYKVQLWDITLLKDFLFWFCSFALVTFLSVNEISTYKDFQKLVLEVFTFSTIVDFIVGNYNFNLGIELIIVPAITILILTQYVASKGQKKSDIAVSNFLSKIITFVGLIILAVIAYKIVIGYKTLFTFATLKSFMLAPILSFFFIPTIYLVVLYMKYEDISFTLRRYSYMSPSEKKKILKFIVIYANLKLASWGKAKTMVISNKYELKEANYSSQFIKAKLNEQ